MDQAFLSVQKEWRKVVEQIMIKELSTRALSRDSFPGSLIILQYLLDLEF